MSNAFNLPQAIQQLYAAVQEMGLPMTQRLLQQPEWQDPELQFRLPAATIQEALTLSQQQFSHVEQQRQDDSAQQALNAQASTMMDRYITMWQHMAGVVEVSQDPVVHLPQSFVALIEHHLSLEDALTRNSTVDWDGTWYAWLSARRIPAFEETWWPGVQAQLLPHQDCLLLSSRRQVSARKVIATTINHGSYRQIRYPELFTPPSADRLWPIVEIIETPFSLKKVSADLLDLKLRYNTQGWPQSVVIYLEAMMSYIEAVLTSCQTQFR